MEKQATIENHVDLHKAVNHLVKHHRRSVPINELATVTGLQITRLYRHFNAHWSATPIQWMWKFRVILAKELIQFNPHLDLTCISAVCGFSTLAHFSRRFKSQMGITAAHYKMNERRRLKLQGGDEHGAQLRPSLTEGQIERLKLEVLAKM
jgi:transcriptional regulator GlxA family with amidase domain